MLQDAAQQFNLDQPISSSYRPTKKERERKRERVRGRGANHQPARQ